MPIKPWERANPPFISSEWACKLATHSAKSSASTISYHHSKYKIKSPPIFHHRRVFPAKWSETKQMQKSNHHKKRPYVSTMGSHIRPKNEVIIFLLSGSFWGGQELCFRGHRAYLGKMVLILRVKYIPFSLFLILFMLLFRLEVAHLERRQSNSFFSLVSGNYFPLFFSLTSKTMFYNDQPRNYIFR